jgi:2-keto-4-pentenoate hydratase/2-oxohepta-3-ene-1,7-dioic acid hydratase in catechol pathway
MRWAKLSSTQSEIHPRIHLGQMIFDIARQIEYCSSFTRLEPGNVIVSGTPGGIGSRGGRTGIHSLKAEAEEAIPSPAPLLPCNPAQPVGSGADQQCQCRISNWLAASHL